MNVCFFDDVGTGHHRAYLAGLVAAAAAEGNQVVAASPECPVPLLSDHQWIQVPETPLRRVYRARQVLRRVIDSFPLSQMETFVDLFFDKNVWALPRTLRHVPRRVHVLHHAHQYMFTDRTLSGKVRTVLLKQRLRALAAKGARIVVHTHQAFEVVSHLAGADGTILAGYPVRSSTEVERFRPDSGSSDDEILFAGQARNEKGLSGLLDALEPLRTQVRLRVVGPQHAEVVGELVARHPSLTIRWENRFVDEAELREHFRQATLVALPYRVEFRRHGGASGVLLEALASGVPVVTTSALSPQLPTAYRGAVVVPENDRAALTAGIRQGLENAGDLRRIAERDGPAFIRAHHTYEQYVRGILRGH